RPCGRIRSLGSRVVRTGGGPRIVRFCVHWSARGLRCCSQVARLVGLIGVSDEPYQVVRECPAAAERANSTIQPTSRTKIRWSIRTVTNPRSCQPSNRHCRKTSRSATYAPFLEPRREKHHVRAEITAVRGIHVSGVDVIEIQHAEVGAPAYHQMLWLLRLTV